MDKRPYIRDKYILVHINLEDREKRGRGVIGYRPSEGLEELLEPCMAMAVVWSESMKAVAM